MNSIDIFLILYLIFSFFLSFLISFLFLRKYRNLEPKISSNKFPYYYCVFNFAIVLFYILLVSLSPFKNDSIGKKNISLFYY